jgi:hypothetical protein
MQPQWIAPPKPPLGWETTAYTSPLTRPLALTLASIYLMATGGLLTLYGAGCGLFAFFVSTSESQPQFAGFAPILTMVGTALFVPGIASIAAGAGAMGGKPWARSIGVVVSILFVFLGGLAILVSLSVEEGLPNVVGSMTVVGFITVAYGLTAWAFVSAAPYFRQQIEAGRMPK